MKIQYIAAIRLPTEKAHGLQIMKMCEAYAQEGHEVELLIPRRTNRIAADPFTYYGVPPIFTITTLWALDTVNRGRIGFWLSRLSFTISALTYMFRNPADLYHSRDELTLAVVSFFTDKGFYEEHTGRWNFLIRRVARSLRLVVISNGLKQYFLEQHVPEERIVIAPDAVDLDTFSVIEDRLEVRKSLGVPASIPLIVYTGHLYAWKGVDTLAAALRHLPEYMGVFIGGTDRDIARFRETYGAMRNVKILGQKPYAEMPRFMQAADVLVIPNSAHEKISQLYTSPMKLFEYMASGRPIVASDLPSIREILNESTGTFAVPDDPADLARAIRTVVTNPLESGARASAALQKVQGYSWRARGRRLVSMAQ